MLEARKRKVERQQEHMLIKRLSLTACLTLIGLVFAGSKACREDYDFGSRSVLPGTPTVGPTTDPTEDPSLITQTPGTGTVAVDPSETPLTPTVVSSLTAEPSASAAPTGTVSTTLTAVPTGTVAAAQMRSVLGEVEKEPSTEDVKARLARDADAGGTNSGKSGNWLGEAFNNEGVGVSEEKNAWKDTDSDGFSDQLETKLGEDPNAKDSGQIAVSSRLNDRLEQYDNDLDGLEDVKEQEYGASPRSRDSDGDGILDGIEVLAGLDPKNKDENVLDRDGDRVPDFLENTISYNASSADTDGDELSDLEELVLSTDGHKVDSDSDGISDGKEVNEGFDPSINDYQLDALQKDEK
jgi:hypothetical protein